MKFFVGSVKLNVFVVIYFKIYKNIGNKGKKKMRIKVGRLGFFMNEN